MAGKQIIWSKRAATELYATLDFFNHRNGNNNYSLRLLKDINDLINTLSVSEFIGRLTENKKTRVLVLKVYLIFYEIQDNQIEILSFWDNRQNTLKRLEV